MFSGPELRDVIGSGLEVDQLNDLSIKPVDQVKQCLPVLVDIRTLLWLGLVAIPLDDTVAASLLAIGEPLEHLAQVGVHHHLFLDDLIGDCRVVFHGLLVMDLRLLLCQVSVGPHVCAELPG